MAYYIGLMSGTSMDGIDAALVHMPDNTLCGGITKKYSDGLKTRIDQLIAGGALSLAEICQLDTLIGREFAGTVTDLLDEAKIPAHEVVAIGSHGQTVCHDTSASIPYTLQLGCAHSIASLTGITVVADFRTRDLVNGGQGAPFAPLYHQELFHKVGKNVAIVNIGGIANVTFIISGQPALGWDVGPGNCLMDAWIQEHHNKSYDADGLWASQGMVINPLLDQLLADPFFGLPSPKSIGKEYYSLSWLKPHLKKEYKPEDVQTTLTALTAHAVSTAIKGKKDKIEELYLCGGGTHNTYLRQLLTDLLPGTRLQSVNDIGVSPDYLEAMMFAWLASQTISHKPVNLSAITGSREPAILGAIYPVIK